MIARWAGLAAAMCMGGCAATVPQFDVPREGDAPTIRSINREITCELLGIARGAPFDQYIAKSRDVYVAAQITLEVTDDGTLAPSLGYATAPFTFGGGLAFEQSRSQYFHAELKYVLSDVKGAADLSEPDCSQPANTNLAGALGLKEIWDLGLSGSPDLKWKDAGAEGAFGGSVTFVVRKALAATGPTWTFSHFSAPGTFLSASENHTDRLTVAFAQGPRAKDRALGRLAAAQFLNSVVQGDIATSLIRR